MATQASEASDRGVRERLLRDYAAGNVTWRELQRCGFEDYIEVLGGLGELNLRPPIARQIGPNIEARRRGRARVAALLRVHATK